MKPLEKVIQKYITANLVKHKFMTARCAKELQITRATVYKYTGRTKEQQRLLAQLLELA